MIVNKLMLHVKIESMNNFKKYLTPLLQKTMLEKVDCPIKHAERYISHS